MPNSFTPTALTFYRIIPSAILFWIFCSLVSKQVVERKDYFRLAMSALLGVFLNQFLFIQGLNLTTPIDSAIIITSNPVLVLLLSALILKEKISTLKITGIAVGATGALILIVSKGFMGFGKEHLLGNILIFINSFSFAAYLAVTKPLMEKYDAFTVLKWIFLFGAIFYFPVGIHSALNVHWSTFYFKTYASLIYVIVATTFLTYLLINYGLKYLKSTTVSIYIYTQPIVAATTAVIFGADELTFINISASLLVFMGVYLVSFGKNMKKIPLFSNKRIKE